MFSDIFHVFRSILHTIHKCTLTRTHTLDKVNVGLCVYYQYFQWKVPFLYVQTVIESIGNETELRLRQVQILTDV